MSQILPDNWARCQFTHRNNPILFIQPIKEELVSFSPRIVLFHDAITDYEIQYLIDRANNNVSLSFKQYQYVSLGVYGCPLSSFRQNFNLNPINISGYNWEQLFSIVETNLMSLVCFYPRAKSTSIHTTKLRNNYPM